MEDNLKRTRIDQALCSTLRFGADRAVAAPDEAAIRLNPIRLYIKNFEWTAQL